MRILIVEHAPLRADNIDSWLSGPDIETTVWKVYENPPPTGDFNGIVISGGPMSAQELVENKNFFFPTETNLIENCLQKNVPTLGICLGCQLLAYLTGGSLAFRQTWQRGWFPIVLNESGESDVLLQNCLKEMYFFEFHQDKVVNLPENACLLASTPENEVEIFKIRDKPFWGIQSHIEVDLAKSAQIFALVKEQSGQNLGSVEQEELGQRFYRADMSRMIFQNFATIVKHESRIFKI